jgi:PhoPQ-activated pathogenicity-related protein
MNQYSIIAATTLIVVALFLLVSSVTSFKEMPIDKYVYTPDKSFSYTIVKTEQFGEVSVTMFNVTSQTWLNDKLVNHPVWTHYLTIAVPQDVQAKDQALLFIEGGSNTKVPQMNNPLQLLMSQNTHSITAWLYGVPNEPLTFYNDTVDKRTEDAIIAYTWDKFFQTKDPYWLARFPMVKASVRALDIVQEFVKKQLDLDIKTFTVAGASKRGWTAWLVAAVDKRVSTVVPMVIDVLNIQPVFKHIYDSICGWPESMQDYVKQGITNYVNKPEFLELGDQVDPLSYIERLVDVEKMMVNAGNDQFFWPDDSTYSFPKIPGTKKRLRYVPNAEHSLAGTDVPFTTASYYYARLYNVALPDYTFSQEFTATGASLSVTVTNGKVPSQVNLWQITNEKARDFRIDTIGRTWSSSALNPVSSNTWNATIVNPTSGYRAFFIELVFANYFEGVTLPALKFTTSAYITPNTFPNCH